MAALIDLLTALGLKLRDIFMLYAKETQEAELSYDPNLQFWIIFWILFFFGSACWATSIASMRRTIFNFSVPLLAGGILCLALVLTGYYGLTSSVMLIFYGLALINCHHSSLPMLGTLGYLELLLGLIDCFVATHALLLWAIGFGLLHLAFGIYLIAANNRT